MSRSSGEREAARLERERQRALSGGATSPPPEPVPPVEPAATPPASAPGDAALPPAPAPETDAAWSWDAPPQPQPDPAPASPPMRSFPSPPPADWHPDDEPIGTIGAPQPGAPGMSPHRPVTVPRRRRGPGRRLLLIVPAVVLLIVALYVLVGVFTPFKGGGTGKVAVRIPAGSSTREIGDLLADRGVVGSGVFFALRAGLSGKDLRAGRFTLARGMGNAEAIAALTRAPATPQTVRLTLTEGPSRREQAPLVAKAGIEGDYLKASERSPALNPRDYGAPRGSSLEGFLFPATYELRAGATASRLVREQVTAFKDNLAQVSLQRARRKNLTRYDVLIIASMIERETAVARERRLVSAVIYNRLKQGIPLGIDATTRYAEGNWSRPLTQSELKRDSPYNTRRNRGLPPTPIGNPGLASIRAAARPASSSALYYVVKPCGDGTHNFSPTAEQFARDVAAYERKREELGGKDPSRCG